MKKYKAAFLDILHFLLVQCDIKISCEDIKSMIAKSDTILRDVPIFCNPRMNFFILYCITNIVFPVLIDNDIMLSDIIDNLKLFKFDDQVIL